MNKVILCGRVCKEIEIRTNNDMAIARFSLAVDRKTKKGEEKKADFISCVAFGSLANFASNYFHKGDAMTLEGRIQTGSYKAKDGHTVYTTDVIAESIEFAIGGKSSNNSANNNSNNSNNNAPSNDGFMNIPESIDDELPFH